MDTNDGVPGKGAIFALRADDGRLVWWFDVVTEATCRPFADDNIRRFDSFHSAAKLGLPEGFLDTRPGCNFDRTSIGCGNIWSSLTVDMRRRQLYTVSSNCDVDTDPNTPPPPVTPPLEEAIISLTLDGDLAWSWRPRAVDPDDLDFGAVPNLFEAEIGGALRDVVGVGGKDGTYYALDRDGVNEITDKIEPYWQTNVVPGGPIGGIIGAASVGEGMRRVQHRLRLQHQPAAETRGARPQPRRRQHPLGGLQRRHLVRALYGRAGSGAVRRHAAAEHQRLRSRRRHPAQVGAVGGCAERRRRRRHRGRRR